MCMSANRVFSFVEIRKEKKRKSLDVGVGITIRLTFANQAKLLFKYYKFNKEFDMYFKMYALI